MPIYVITASASGSAVVQVEAADEAAAEAAAYAEHLTGILIDGGEATWTVDTIEELAE